MRSGPSDHIVLSLVVCCQWQTRFSHGCAVKHLKSKPQGLGPKFHSPYGVNEINNLLSGVKKYHRSNLLLLKCEHRVEQVLLSPFRTVWSY